MRILQLSPGYPPDIGGVENSVYQVVKRLRRLGHQVIVITANRNPMKNLREGTFSEARRLPVLLRIPGDWGGIRVCPTIINELGSIDFDIAHAHTPEKFFAESLTFYRLLARRKFPYVVSVRLINESLPSFFRSVNDVYRKTVEKLVFGNASRVVAQSNASKRFLMEACKLDEEKIDIIPNGVDTALFSPLSDKPKSLKQVHTSTERIILFVGRLTSQKGLGFLLEAFASIQKTVPYTRLVVVGDGPMRSHFIKMSERLEVAQRVSFVGAVGYDEMPKWYSVSDIFVLASLSESFPNALLEAMATKRGIVATRVGVIPEMLRDGETALLVNPGDKKGLENGILRLLSDERLRLQLGENARKLAATEYSWESVVSQTISMYETVLSMKSS